MRRLARAVVTIGWLVLVLAGLPYGLVLLDRMALSGVDRATLAAEPLTAPVLVVAGTAVGWVLWAWLLSMLVHEVSRRRRSSSARVRLAVPWHRPFSAVTSAVVLLIDAVAAQSAPPASAPAPVDAASTATATNASIEALPAPANVDDLINERGIKIGGGWLPLPAAAGVGAALTALWRHGRRTYLPRPPGPADRDDPQPVTPPSSLAALYDAGPVADAPAVTVGADPDVWLGLDDLPAGGVGLTGPGALDAARALLTTAVAAHLAGSEAPPVLATADDLQTLAGTTVESSGLHTAEDVDELLDVATNRPGGGRLMLLHVGPLPSHAAGPLAAALDAGKITAVLVGAWPQAQTWYVEADGMVRRRAGAFRLGVLNQPAAAAILGVVAEAHRLIGPSPEAQPGQASTELLLRVLGPVDLRKVYPDGSHTSVRLRRAAAAQILAYLAVQRDGATSDEIKEALWPDVAGSLADRRFQVTMSDLRGVLHAAAGVAVLHPRRATHRLDPDAIRVDLWQLHDLLDKAATSINEEVQQALLNDAIHLDEGEFAEGLDADWLHTVRESTVRHLIDVYCHLAGAAPDHEHAVGLLRRAIRLAPQNETLYQALISRLDAAGNIEGARRARATLTQRLAEVHPKPGAVTDSAGPSAGAHQ
jgi:DNA-binding SARP family transcriptional activator